MRHKTCIKLTTICGVLAVSLLLLYFIMPSNEAAYQKQITKQHKQFCEGLIKDNDAYVNQQIPKHTPIYCEIVTDTITKSVVYYNIIWNSGEDSIKIKEAKTPERTKYYTLYDKDDKKVNNLKKDISYSENIDTLISLLTEERKKELSNITTETDSMLSIITNLLIGNDSSLIAYIEDKTLKFIYSDDVCIYYINKDSLKNWCHSNKSQLEPSQSLYDFLIENRIISELPYQIVRMNYRDDRLYINNVPELFNANNKSFQQACMKYPLVAKANNDTIWRWEERNSRIGKNISWCKNIWVEKTKTKSLEIYNIKTIEPVVYNDKARIILLILFLTVVICTAILLYVAYKLSNKKKDDDNDDETVQTLLKKIKTLEASKKALEEDNKNISKELKDLQQDSDISKKKLNDVKRENKELILKHNDLVNKYNSLLEKNKRLSASCQELQASIDNKIEDATQQLKETYKKIEKEHPILLQYYSSTKKVIEQIVPCIKDITKEDMRFWDRVMLQQVAIQELLLPLLGIYCKDLEIKSKIEIGLKKMQVDNLQQFMFLYLERTLRYGNITAQEFSQAIKEKIPQEIANYNLKVKDLKLPNITINQAEIKKYTECASLIQTKVAQLKLDENFKTNMWANFGKEFTEKVDETKDKAWFFKHVITIAYYTAEYLQFYANKSTDMSYYYNLTYLHNEFDRKYPKAYEHNYYGKSNSYADRIYDWCKELGIEHLPVLISEYLILP